MYPFASSLDDEIDWAAIQAALDAAAVLQTPSVCIPPGRYRLTRAIRPEVDNLTLFGAGGTVLVVDPAAPRPGQAYDPEAILVNRQETPQGPVEPVRGLTIRDIAVDVLGGSSLDTFSAGAVQLNHCPDCSVESICVRYVGSTPKPKNIDGIVTAIGTSGSIRYCTVDGIPKAGIYIAQGTRDLVVEACEVKNTSGPADSNPRFGRVGIAVSGADRITIANCASHHNEQAGLLVTVAVNGPTGGGPTPATNVQVIGGRYHHNTFEGILVGSCANTVAPRDIQLMSVAAFHNDGRGISIEAGCDVLIANPTVADSGAQGIWIENVPVPFDESDPSDPRRPCDGLEPDPAFPRTTRVQISNPSIRDSGRLVNVRVPAIALRAVDQVLVAGGTLSKNPGASASARQAYGIGLHKRPIPLPGFSDTCSNLRIVDVDATLGQLKPVAALDVNGNEDSAAAGQSGYYRIQARGLPEGSLTAPPGSEYLDLSTGFLYRKAAGGTGSSGWVLV